MKKGSPFTPTEIIFSCTTACNLHCQHCFVNRTPKKIEIESAVKFLAACRGTSIEKIGFSGGEPFLYMDFLCQVTKAAVENDFMFDQIMTNGDWWKDENDLFQKLQTLYDAGYDGKIGLSWDSYHGQNTKRMETFIGAVHKIFGEDAINIQTVDDENKKGESLPLAHTSLLATPSSGVSEAAGLLLDESKAVKKSAAADFSPATAFFALFLYSPIVLIISCISSGSASAMEAASGYFANSAGVTLFTDTSVVWAESITAVSSWNLSL